MAAFKVSISDSIKKITERLTRAEQFKADTNRVTELSKKIEAVIKRITLIESRALTCGRRLDQSEKQLESHEVQGNHAGPRHLTLVTGEASDSAPSSRLTSTSPHLT